MAFRRLRYILIGACVQLFVSLAASNAMAFELFGFTFFEDAETADANAVIADPQAYTVDVSVSGNTDLEDTLRGASTLWTKQASPASGAAGLLATARSDYRRIVAALYAEGYYGGTVSITVDGREATSLPPDAELSDPAIVAIRVDTGPQFQFGDVSIANRSGESDPAITVASGFASGEIAKSGAVRRAARQAVDDWRQLGYPKAKIADQDVLADHDTNIVDVSLTVAPGPRATIGTITVEGATDMDADFIARHTGLVEGKLYDPDDITRARQRLNELEVFGTVKIVEADAVNPDGSLPITIVVNERKPRRVGVGGTYSTTDGLGVETFWLHRNLFGQGERLRFDARLTGIAYPIQTKEFDYYFGGTFTKPGVFTPDTDLIAGLVAQRTVLPRYSETSIEGKVGVSHEFSQSFKKEVGLELKRANFYDTVYGHRDFSVFGAYGTLTYDTRDDPNDATEGVFASVTAAPYYEAEYGNAALLLSAEARSYVSLAPEDRVVVAGRLKAGFLLGPDLSETPPDKLFFAGGGGSVRGFPYRSIGADGPGGAVVGGKFLTEASVEARVKVTDDIGVVGFVDAGYVTANNFVGLADGTRIGAGVGLRYYTGFGPLRLDVAVPINRRPGDPKYAIYAGIGQAF